MMELFSSKLEKVCILRPLLPSRLHPTLTLETNGDFPLSWASLGLS
jgi:hypothetical protein